jgi:hypothetical protein
MQKFLLSFWEGSNQPAGLEISKGESAKGAIRYISKYITKLESFTNENKWSYLNKFMWYFRVRIYNIRHHRQDKTNPAGFEDHPPKVEKKFEYISQSSFLKIQDRMKKMSDGSWTEQDERDFQNEYPVVGGIQMTGNLKADLKKLRKLPVQYPDQIRKRF